jgi:hypothetical protein
MCQDKQHTLPNSADICSRSLLNSTSTLDHRAGGATEGVAEEDEGADGAEAAEVAGGLSALNPNVAVGVGEAEAEGIEVGGTANSGGGAGEMLRAEKDDVEAGLNPKPENADTDEGTVGVGAASVDGFAVDGVPNTDADAGVVNPGAVDAGAVGAGAENCELGFVTDAAARALPVEAGEDDVATSGEPAVTHAVPMPFIAPENVEGHCSDSDFVSLEESVAGLPNPKKPVLAGLLELSSVLMATGAANGEDVGALGANAGGFTGAALANSSCFASFSRVTGGLASGELRKGAELKGFGSGLPEPKGDGIGALMGLADGGEGGRTGEPGGVLLCALDGGGTSAPDPLGS